MFAYVDPHIKQKLLDDKKLICLNESGRLCRDSDANDTPYITIVGPVPLPLRLSKGSHTFDWYAWVRHTELERIEDVV